MEIIKSIINRLGLADNNHPTQATPTSEIANNANAPHEYQPTPEEGAAAGEQMEDSLRTETKRNLAQGEKSRIYNLIIVDESGSMSGLRKVTLSGINETIDTIRESQKELGEAIELYVTLVTFDERSDNTPSVRTIIDAAPAIRVGKFTDYSPTGCTPLYDAIGDSLTNLKEKMRDDENATGVVTILTDGLENASQRWDAKELRRLIEQLKEEGWTFSYMGSAHNVKEVTDLLSIDNVTEFTHDDIGTNSTWLRERSSRKSYFCKAASEFDANENWEEKKARRRRYNEEYYGNRVTRHTISSLEPDEIFVFGSDPKGAHNGGAARSAVNNFGAQKGVGEGLQGQSYAIPTTDGMQLMEEAVHRFCTFAKEHREMKFLVTRIGCGIAGYSPKDIAPLFKEAVEIENISLPADFWEVLGLKMFN